MKLGERHDGAHGEAPWDCDVVTNELSGLSLPTVESLLARLAFDAPCDWIEELPHNRWLSCGVWRVYTNDGRSKVMKYMRSDQDNGETRWDAHWTARSQDPRRWNYWKREPLAYQHHLPDAFAGTGISAPACERCWIDDREALILLEWSDGKPGESWSLGDYGTVAAALGRAQAPFLRSRPLPSIPWLSQSFLRDYSSEKPVEWGLLDDNEVWKHPLVREVFPPGLRDGVAFVHANRERLYQISESLPRTLCHLDFWPKNLFRLPNGHAVVIDWGCAGIGAIGEDVGNLVPDASFDHFIAADDLSRLERVVFDGYVSGLRSAGWDGDPRIVELGMWSSSIKYDWLAPFLLAKLDQGKQYRYGGSQEIDAAVMFRERSHALLFNANWARQALELAEQLGL